MIRPITLLVACVLVGSLTVQPPAATKTLLPGLELDGQSVLGYCSVVRSVGGTTYAGFGSAIAAIDTTDPRQPRIVARAFVPNCFDGKIDLRRDPAGDRLFVPRDIYGLGAFQVSGAAAPRHEANYPPDPDGDDHAGGVAVSGGHVLWAAGHEGLVILDADPSSPGYMQPVGQWRPEPLDFALGVCVHAAGDIAYLCTRSTGVHVIDVRDPSRPRPADPPASGRIPSYFATDMAASASHGFVADGPGGVPNLLPPYHAELYPLKVVDLATGEVIGRLGLPDADSRQVYYRSVALREPYLYAASGLRGVDVIDVSAPARPVLVRNLPTAAYSSQLSLAGDVLYVADCHAGLSIYSLADPASPRRIAALDPVEVSRDVAVAGGFAYVAYGRRGLAIVDVTSPGAPSAEILYDAYQDREDTETQAVFWDGSLLYVADGREGLKVLRLDDPRAPELVRGFPGAVDARDVQVVGRNVYLADHDHAGGGLWILDAGRLGQPGFEPRHLAGIGHVGRIHKLGDWVYAASNGPAIGCTSHNGLRLIREDTLAVHQWLDSGYGNISDVDAAEIGGRTYAFASTSGGPSLIPGVLPPPPSRVHILRNDGGVLTELGSSPLHFQGSYFGDSLAALEVAGQRAYIDHTNTGIYVYNVADPDHPVEEAFYRLTCNNSSGEIHLFGERIYSAHGDSGLYLFRFLEEPSR